jgi:hypothetical protein
MSPVRKGSGGKWRIGSGKAMYKTKAAAQRAYRGYLAKKRGKGTNLRIVVLEVPSLVGIALKVAPLARRGIVTDQEAHWLVNHRYFLARRRVRR